MFCPLTFACGSLIFTPALTSLLLKEKIYTLFPVVKELLSDALLYNPFIIYFLVYLWSFSPSPECQLYEVCLGCHWHLAHIWINIKQFSKWGRAWQTVAVGGWYGKQKGKVTLLVSKGLTSHKRKMNYAQISICGCVIWI